MEVWPDVMFAEGASDEEDFTRINVHKKSTYHKMVSIFKKIKPSNPEREGSQVDVEEWTNVDEENEVSHTITDEELTML